MPGLALGCPARLELVGVLLLEALRGAGATNTYTTSLTSPYGYQCGQEIYDAADYGSMYEDEQGDQFQYVIDLTSPTTFGIIWRDRFLQRSRAFHPLKCDITDGATQWTGGRFLLLQNACFLKNSEDISSCFRKQYFPYPVDPHSDTVKHELRRGANGSLAVWPGSLIQVYNRSSDAADLARQAFPDAAKFEVCAHTGSCVPGRGLCQPSFWLIAESWLQDPYVNAWASLPSSSFRPALSISSVAYDWNQVHHTPQYGPYPHCPNDENGRAAECLGNETATIRVSALEVKEAKIEENGQKVVFDIKFKLEWGDRYAVHPCTINLNHVRTGGSQMQVNSDRFWTPNITAINEKEREKVKYAAPTLGVNLDHGQPVKRSVDPSLNWPKQLVLEREYRVVYYPEPKINWRQYPYDTQTVKVVLGEMKIDPSKYRLELSPTAMSSGDIDVGDDWEFKNLNVRVVTEDGRSALSIEVAIKRLASSKMYTLMFPALSFVCLDTVGHLIMPYESSAELFMAQALMIGVSIAMLDPGFLGIPVNLNGMPYIQCFVLMLIVGALKTACLLIGRSFWTMRIHRLQEKVQVEADEEQDAKIRRRLAMLHAQVRLYDFFVKASVPIWYFVALLAVSGAYGVL